MKVAIDLRSVAETGGKISGVENYCINLFNRLTSEHPGDFIEIINRYKPAHFPESMEVPLYLQQTRIPNKLFNAELALTRYPKFENLYGPFDILWMPDIRPFAIKPKTKLAVTVHDLSPLMHPEYYSLKRRLWHTVASYKRAILRADAIFAVSEYTKSDIVKKFNISPERVKVIYPGVDLCQFKPKEQFAEGELAAVWAHYHLPKKYILALSTIEPRKNIASLITAFENISDNQTELVIAGRLGWLYKPLLNRIANSPKHKKIHVLGYISEKDKPAIIAQAEMLCYPSFYEGFGFQPLEAMACGVPVVASARTSVPEVCGGAALIVEPNHPEDIAEAINALLRDAPLRAAMIAKGLARAPKFDWHAGARRIYDTFKELSGDNKNLNGEPE
jgi:glycosyltransferase involved in cell wall biosynthesis